MSKTMLAAVLHGIKDLRVHERAIPRLEPGKALVRVRRGGICGSDVHYFEEGRFGSFAVTAPFILGHEITGEVGADSALDPMAGEFQDQVTALTGDGFEFLFEASGAVRALCQAFEVVRRGGTIVQIGVYSAPGISLPVNQLLVRELQFIGSFRYGNVWEETIRLVTSGRVNLRPLISRVFPLRQAKAALELACSKRGVVKVQVDLLSN